MKKCLMCDGEYPLDKHDFINCKSLDICWDVEQMNLKNDINTSGLFDYYYIKPPIKWVGGKTQILNKLMYEFPQIIENYHEIFLGGGSVLLALLYLAKNGKKQIKGNVFAYDVNLTLIGLFNIIKTQPQALIDSVRTIINEFNNIAKEEKPQEQQEKHVIKKKVKRKIKPKNLIEGLESKESYYYWIRSEFNRLENCKKDSLLGVSYFLFLNKTCWRGVYREGPNGFNVPYGNNESPEIINAGHIYEISALIQNVVFTCSKFEDSFLNVNVNDFVYLDPPYTPDTSKSFVGYTKKGFTLEQHKLLFQMCKKYPKFLMSNSDVELVKQSFNDSALYNIKTILCKRAINSVNPGSKVNEVLIKSN
jgi:DNA adenine methylase